MSQEDLLVERLVNRIKNANTDILEEIGRAFNKIGRIKKSDIFVIQQELKYGESLDKIVKTIDKMTMLNRQDIVEILDAVAKKDQEFAKIYYEAKNKPYIPFDENIPLQNKLQEIKQATLGAYMNISSTSGLTYLDRFGNKVSKPIINAYWQMVDDAVMNVSMGKETFQEAMKKQIKTLTENGITSIGYDSTYIDKNGQLRHRKRRLDSAIRMNMQDALKDMAIAQQEIIGEQFDHDAMEVSVHEYPAPDHEDIQGHIFDLENWKKLQDYLYMGDIEDVNGNIFTRSGENPIRAIGDLNCRHIVFATIKGVKPRYSQEQLNEINRKNKEGFEFEGKKYSMYEGTQIQRNLETELRRQKDIQVMARASGDNELAQEAQKNINLLTSKYNQFNKVSGLPPQLERTRVLGYRKIKVEEKPVNTSIEIKKDEQSITPMHENRTFEDRYDAVMSDLTNKNVEIRNVESIDKELLLDNLEQLDYLTSKYNISNEKKLTLEGTYYKQNVYGYTREKINGIWLNNRWYRNKEKLIDGQLGDAKTGWSYDVAKGKEGLYTLTHEYGHRIEFTYINKVLGKTGDYVSRDMMKKMDTEIKDTIIRKATRNNKMTKTEFKKTYFSGYAKSKRNYEWFAEGFAKMELGESSPLTDAIKEWLEEIKDVK